jgi:F420H(2)-dependent quinone reductase
MPLADDGTMNAAAPTDGHANPATTSSHGSAALTGKDRRLVRTMKVAGKIHRFVLRASRGRIGNRWYGGTDIVLLTVRGRTTGASHTVPLMSLSDGRDVLVVASQGGVDREPQWWLNLLADPHAEAVVRGERFAVVAEKVGDDERPAIWDRFVTAYEGFNDYQAKVQRQIAVVRLHRA